MSKDRVRAFQPVFSMHPVPSREHQHPRRQITLDHPPPAFRRRHIAARQAPLPQAVVFTTRKRLSGDPGVAMGFVAGDQPVAMIAPVMIRNDVQPHYVVAPIFENARNPIPRRSGLLEREANKVVIPAIDTAALRAEAKTLGQPLSPPQKTVCLR